MERQRCHDCGVFEGEIHHFGCDVEACPLCGEQLIGCGCWQRHPEMYVSGSSDMVFGRPYLGCLGEAQRAQWLQIVEAVGRVPYVQWPVVCARCGALYPDMFQVPDEEWARYVEIGMRKEVLCRSCYEQIRGWTDEAAGRPRPSRELPAPSSREVLKFEKLAHYAQRDLVDFHQFDGFDELSGLVEPDKDGDELWHSFTRELMTGAWAVRILVTKGTSKETALRLLRKLLAYIEEYGVEIKCQPIALRTAEDLLADCLGADDDSDDEVPFDPNDEVPF